MNTELHTKLINDGYLSFDLDNETKEKLKPIADKLKHIEFTNLRHTGCGETDTSDASFENLEKLKEKYAPLKKWQVWYQDTNFRPKISEDEYIFLREVFTNIIENVYPADSYDTNYFINCTMYNKLCYINRHQDGGSHPKLTNILIYLNNDYKEGMGGEIVINDTATINPELGKVAVIDFSKNNFPRKPHSEESKQKIKLGCEKTSMEKFGVKNVPSMLLF
jgi:Rps23 Pro-64 3,4-dihydroxylase Tpa1-like proline 4-hydroxylase